MIFATARKEITLLLRDAHALAVLFLMPLVFVVIMSLAMPDASKPQTVLIKAAIIDAKPSVYSAALRTYLLNSPGIDWQKLDDSEARDFQTLLKNKSLDAVIVLPEHNDRKALDKTQSTIYLAPHINAQTRQLIDAAVLAGLGKSRLFMFLKDMNGAQGAEDLARLQIEAEATTLKDQLNHQYVFAGEKSLIPTAVQQSVPAWLVFGMFFVLIPLSSTLIVELQQGTLRRLQSMDVSAGAFLAGKLAPYFVINQLQLLIMLAAGHFLIPALGGSMLQINGSWGLLALMSTACSVAALGFAMLISVLVKSTEQATALGGAANIILAAIGGIMIPKFVMPETMQVAANISPMSWALDGFLEVILMGNSFAAIAPYAASLFAFAAVCFALAVLRFNTLSGYGH